MKILLKLVVLLIISVNIGFSQTSIIKLTAKKKYSPVSYIDGDTTLSIPVDFKIPNELNVTHGEAGSHKAKLSYRQSNGVVVELTYKGDDDDENRNQLKRATNSNYVFESSSKYGIKPGVHVVANRIGLHIVNGEKRAGTTEVVLSILSTNNYGVQKCPNGTVRLYFYSNVPITNVTWTNASTSYTSVSYYAGAPSFSYRSEIYLPFYNGPYSIVANLSDGTSATRSPVTETTSTAPIVNAGPDQSTNVCTSNYSFNLAGSVTGLSTSGSWSTSGSGSFSNLNALNAVYTFSPADISNGSIVLTLTSIGHACNNSDQVILSVPLPAKVNAGPDQSICTTTVNLNGTRGGGSTGAVWSGGAGTFSPNANTLNAVYTPTTAEKTTGSITLTWTATGSPCGNVSDQVMINLATPPTANAGPDQSAVDCNSNMFTLSGSVTSPATGGVWMGGTGTFTPNNTSLNAVYTMSVAEINAGTVTLTLTTTGGLCGSTGDQIVLTAKKLKPIWATFFGGNGADNIEAMDVDPASHDIVVAGYTDGTTQTLPLTGATVVRSIGTMGIGKDAFAARITSDGKNVLWITYIGGTDNDKSDGIRFDAAGNIYWTGTTESLNFPTTVSGLVSDNVGETPFVCRMNGDGSLAWSAAYMQGFDAYADGITVTNDNHAIGGTIFITGSYDTQIPCRQKDIYALRINKITGTQIWMSFFGGPDIDCPGDNGNCIVHDALGNIYIGGSSYGDVSDGSIDLTCAANPTPALNFAAKEAPGLLYTNNTHTGTPGQYADAIAVKFDANGTLQSWQMTGGLLHDSYIGVALMPNGEVVFVGYYDFVYNPGSILLTRTNANLSGIEKQVIHGNVSEYGLGISIDAQGKVYIIGNTLSTDLYSKFGSPASYRNVPTGGWDMFMARMQVQGGSLKADWFSYYGSDPSVTGTPGDENGLTTAADSDGSFYAAGSTNSDNFEWIASPIQPPTIRYTGPGLPYDGAIIKFTCNGTSSSSCSGCRTGFTSGQDENNSGTIVSNSSSVQIYPNPFNNELNILINGSDEKYVIEILDTKGILVYSKEDVAANLVNVVGDNLSSGVYILKVISEKETVTTKLIKTE